MGNIRLKKGEMGYLWAWMMAMAETHKSRFVKDKELIRILAKIKRQAPYLLNIKELKGD